MFKKVFGIMILALSMSSGMSVLAAEVETGEYSVPYTIMNAYNDSVSMADDSRDGNMTVIINDDGTADYYMNVKARVQDDLIGHIIELWNIPSLEIPSGAPSDYEKDDNKAEVISTVTEKGLDGNENEYASAFHFTRNGSAEDHFYIRVNVDAMGTNNQNAKLVFDWSKSELKEQAYTVSIDLWNSVADQASMGNAAVANNREALLIGDTLYIATNPVDVSGYGSALTDIKYDTTGNGDYAGVEVIKTDVTNSGVKHDSTDHEIKYVSLAAIKLPEYINKKGIEYINVKMQVPYTPMDAVAVGTDGYLDARLKLDWNTIKASDAAELTPNTNKASGTSSITGEEIQDIELKSMGVSLIADTEKIPTDTKFKVTKITDENLINSAKELLGGTDFTLYRIETVANGNSIEPNGSVKLSMPYADGMTVYRINESGGKTVLKVKNENDKAVVTTTSLGLFAITGVKLGFSDMDGHWASEYVSEAVEKGLFNGVSDTEFAPESMMTNGMVITVLYRIAGEPNASVNDPAGMWYDNAVAWGLENSIIGDYGDVPFDPERNVTREEFATMLYRYESLSGGELTSASVDGFEDKNDISQWADEAFKWAFAAGIINGKTDTMLMPKANATRAEVATMLIRYMK